MRLAYPYQFLFKCVQGRKTFVLTCLLNLPATGASLAQFGFDLVKGSDLPKDALSITTFAFGFVELAADMRQRPVDC